MRKIIIVLALMSSVGCANVGTKFNVAEIEVAPDNAAIVFFYRPSRFQGGGVSMPVIANKVKIGTLDNGTYFKQIMSPGVYKIHSDTTPGNLLSPACRTLLSILNRMVWLSSCGSCTHH